MSENSGNDEYAHVAKGPLKLKCDPAAIKNLEKANATLPHDASKQRSKKSPPWARWWNAECKQAITERRQAQKNWQNDCSDAKWDIYKRSVAKAKKVVAKAKAEDFRKFGNSLPSGLTLDQAADFRKFGNSLPPFLTIAQKKEEKAKGTEEHSDGKNN